ncbi:MAG: hypothetical protein AB7E24_06575, partial [Novosphingobium sp.]
IGALWYPTSGICGRKTADFPLNSRQNGKGAPESGSQVTGSTANISSRINEMGLKGSKNPQLPRGLLITTEPRRLPGRPKAVSDRLLSHFTRTSPEKVRIENITVFQVITDITRPPCFSCGPGRHCG